MRRLILSPAAIADLREIAQYTRVTWGAEQEASYLKNLWRKFEAIRSAPETYRLRDDLLAGCRSARHEKHVIFIGTMENRSM